MTSAAIVLTVFAAATALAQDQPMHGALKICKVAGEGIDVGDEFEFTVDGEGSDGTVVVRAGPAPGGYCWFHQRTLPIGSVAYVTESLAPGVVVEDIDVQPAEDRWAGEDLSGGLVRIRIGSGITEVTYKNAKRTGYVELCKEGPIRGETGFTIGGVSGEFAVPTGACTPAIETPATAAGAFLTVTEFPPAGTSMVGCRTIPANRKVGQNLNNRTCRIKVPVGDISTQTIVIFENRPNGPANAAAAPLAARFADAQDLDGSTPSEYGLPTTVSCGPVASSVPSVRQVNKCTARVAPAQSSAEPTGFVRFTQAGRPLAIVPLTADGAASLALPPTWPGANISADYLGNNPRGARTVEQPRTYRPGEKAPTDDDAARLNANQQDLMRLEEFDGQR